MQGAYAAACSYPGPPVDKGTLGFCKLPKYDEIIRIPPSGSPPPPYRSHRNLNTIAAIEANSEGVASMKFLSYNDLTSSVLSLVNSIGFSFGQRSFRDRMNVRQQNQPESPNDLSLSDSLSSFGMLDNEINNNEVPNKRKNVHIIKCKQSTPQRAGTETNFVNIEQSNTLEEIPGTSANRSESSPHISLLQFTGACSNENLQDKSAALHSPTSTDPEVPKQKVVDESSSQISGKIFAKSIPYGAKEYNLKINNTDDASSDEEMDGPIYFEVDENNNDSMQSVYSAFSPECSKKRKGKSILRNL